MAERPAEFDLVGDPDALPDAFFDALAGLLLDIGDTDTRQPPDKADRPGTPAHSVLPMAAGTRGPQTPVRSKRKSTSDPTERAS